ncbi:MAG: M20/M25/M40 family metallo-hydrolase [Candidatus Aminicenantes bacterium]|nr:M20/M25/M40 family metallo-hydrolase [Candidatus Aminicenantes bacterium]
MVRKKAGCLAVSIMILGSFLVPLSAEEKIDYSIMQRIRTEGLGGSSKVMDYLSWLSDVYAPRLSESPQYRQAAQWALRTLTEMGLVDAKMEPWGTFGRGWRLKKFYGAMTAPQYMPLIAYPKAWTPGTNGVVTGEAVLLDVKTVKDLEKYKGKLKGAVVLTQPEQSAPLKFSADASRLSEQDLKDMLLALDPGERSRYAEKLPDVMARFQLQAVLNKFAVDEGAAVLIEGSKSTDGTVFVTSGGTQLTSAPPVPPAVVVSVEQYNRMVRILGKKIPVTLEIEIQTEFSEDDPQGYNLVAEFPGSDKKLKNEIVMLGAHFDTWHSGTGATDDGAGCAVVLEALRILKAIGAQPRRTIRVALWDAEEQGLIGSQKYVTNHFYDRSKREIKPEYDRLAAYFNFDNGSGKIRGVYAQGNLAVMPIFEAWLQPFHDLGAATVTTRTTGGSDHISFDSLGLPGFQFIQDDLEYETLTHHSNMDVFDHASRGDLMQAATIMAAFVYNAAMRDEKLPRKFFEPAGPTK